MSAQLRLGCLQESVSAMAGVPAGASVSYGWVSYGWGACGSQWRESVAAVLFGGEGLGIKPRAPCILSVYCRAEPHH